MSDLRSRQDARQRIEDAVWELTRQIEDLTVDRNRWRSLAVGWARDTVAGHPHNVDSAAHIIAVAEEEARRG